MDQAQIARRRLVSGMAALATLPWRMLVGDDGLLPPTPSATEGPFYPIEIPEDSDNDLLWVMGHEAPASGRLAFVRGRVMDRAGQIVDGARVEIWQCDNQGVYHHSRHRGTPDNNFQGFGAMATDRDGAYFFRTIAPTPYSGRTPHIHFRISADGFDRLTTQLYVAEAAERNSRDSLYMRHSSDERALVTAAFVPVGDDPQGPVAANFDIVLS